MDNKLQKQLQTIVESWDITSKPEYRGFRCGLCQKYKNEAWYFLLDTTKFLVPVHLCDNGCKEKFLQNKLVFSNRKAALHFHQYTFSKNVINRFAMITKKWKTTNPVLKKFFCDECGKVLIIDKKDKRRKGFHIWWDNKGILTELHFHRSCATKLDIFSKS